jgi:hypothetical protein
MIIRLQDWYSGLRLWKHFNQPEDHCTCTIIPWCVLHDIQHEEA